MAASAPDARNTFSMLAATPASQVASTSAMTLDHGQPVKMEEESEDAKLLASLVNGIQTGMAAGTSATAAGSFGSVVPTIAPSPFGKGTKEPKEDAPSGPIQAYAKLEFPGFSYYIQTLDFTIGRRPTAFRAQSSDEQHITGASKLNGDVDVDLGPLKSISRIHVRIFYQDLSYESTWNPSTQQHDTHASTDPFMSSVGSSSHDGGASGMLGGGRSASLSSSARGSSFDGDDRNAKAQKRVQQGRFVLQVLGRNGACVDDVYVGLGALMPLGKRTKIQIAERVFYFVLPPSQTIGAMDSEHPNSLGMESDASLGSSDDMDESSDDDDGETSSGSLGSSSEDDSKDESGSGAKFKKKLAKTAKELEMTPKQLAEASSIANRKRKRGEPLDEAEKITLKVGTPIGVEALNLHKKKKKITSDAADANQASIISSIVARATDSILKGQSADKMAPGTDAVELDSSSSGSSTPSSNRSSLPPEGPGEKPDKTNLELVREALSSPLAAGRGGKLTLDEIYGYLLSSYEWFRNNGRENKRDWRLSIRQTISSLQTMVRIERKPTEPGNGVFLAFGTSDAAVAARAERGAPLDAPGDLESPTALQPLLQQPPHLPFMNPTGLGGLPMPMSMPMSMSMPMTMPMSMPMPMPMPGAAMQSMPQTTPPFILPPSLNPTPPMPSLQAMHSPSVPSVQPPVPKVTIPTTTASPTPPVQSAAPVKPKPKPPSTPRPRPASPSSATASASPTPRSAAASPSIAPDGRVRIVLGKAPAEALAKMAAAPKAAITQSIEALFGGPPIVHHEGTLFLSPIVFGKMSAQEINDIGGKGAQQALATLQAQLVAHLQSKMAGMGSPSPAPQPQQGPAQTQARPPFKPGARPPLASTASAVRPTNGATSGAPSRPALARPPIPVGTALNNRPPLQTRPPNNTGIAVRVPGAPSVATQGGTLTGSQPGANSTTTSVRPVGAVPNRPIGRPPLNHNIHAKAGVGIARPTSVGRPGRPPLQRPARPPSSTIAAPGAAVGRPPVNPPRPAAAATGQTPQSTTGAANGTASGTTTGSISAPVRPGQVGNGTSTSSAAAGSAVRPGTTVSRPPLKAQSPIVRPPAKLGVGRPPLSARPRAAALPGQQVGRPPSAVAAAAAAAMAGQVRQTPGGATAARPPLTNASAGVKPTPTTTPAATSTPANTSGSAPASGQQSQSSASSSTSSADMAALLALLTGGTKLDSNKLTPAQHELLQRAGRLAAEQQQRAQQQKATQASPATTAAATPSNSSVSGPNGASSTSKEAPAPDKAASNTSASSLSSSTAKTGAPNAATAVPKATTPAAVTAAPSASGTGGDTSKPTGQQSEAAKDA